VGGRRYSLINKASPVKPDLNPPLDRLGLLCAIAAYVCWGFMPLFFKQLAGVPSIEIIAHRVIWAVPLLLIIVAVRRQLHETWRALSAWSTLRWMLVSAVFISANWLIYVFAINSGHILAASLGYYFNPLLNIVLGTLFLGERLNRLQWVAVGIAGIAAVVLAYGALDTMGISLSIAASFCFYGFVRKLAPVGAVPGLTIETILLCPIAMGVAYYYSQHPGNLNWGSNNHTTLLLIAGGAITAIPLLLFATAARRMAYSTLGFIQYIGPTIQFLLGVFLYKEPLSGPRILAFILIWSALALFSYDAIKRMRAV
jgi:chloramphenicol-sensitive protein RarD